MNPQDENLLRVRISVFEGEANGELWDRVAVELASQALQDDDRALPVCGVILLASADWCLDPSRSLPKLLRTELHRKLSYQVQLVGGSMPRIFASVPQAGGKPDRRYFIEKGVVAITLFSRDIWFAVRSLESPFTLSEQERKRQLAALESELRSARVQHMGLGSSVQIELLAIMPGPVTSADGTREFRDEELHRELLDAFGNLLMVFGGSAGDQPRATCGYQFANDDCIKSGLALALMENDLKLGSAMGHGFKFQAPPLRATVTRLDDPSQEASYLVAELSGRPASEVLQEWHQQDVFKRERPIFGVGTSEYCQVAATANEPPFTGPTVRFNRRLPLGASLFVMDGDEATLQQGALAVLDRAKDQTRSAPGKLRLCCTFCCAGRYRGKDGFEDAAWIACMNALADRAGGTSVVCAVCVGEFGEDHRRRARADSYSIWACFLANEKGRRSDTRSLQNALLRASVPLLSCTTPEGVMDKALEGAIEAGAEGGQVCLADKSINLILGSKVGRARNRSGGKQRWDLVVAETIVPLPGCEERVRLPESLRATMLSAGHRPTGSQLRDLDDEDDVLKIVSIERSPLFVPDSNDKSFHCHSGRTSLGSLEAQFVSPMLGSGDDLIGTFQVGFVKNHPMDRERMGLWTGYSQKVAAALERALEFGERRRLEAITEVWNSILQAPTPVGNPDPLLEAFTAEVQKQLGAYYVHLRVRELVNGVVCYRLVAPASELGALHRRVRKYTGTGDEGSVAIAEKREPRFTNCKKETDDLLGLASRATFEAATGEDQHRWKKESGRLRSVGVVALHYGEDFLGALVVDSEDEYFFTERRRRLSELAAAKASLILAKLRAETRLQQVVYRGLYAADNVHNIMQPLVNVQLGIEALLGSGLDQKTATSLNVLLGENARTMGLLKNAAKGSEIGESPMPLGELLSSTIKLGIAVEWQSNDDKRAVLRANLFLRSAIKRLAENAIEAAGTTDKVWPRVSRAREGMILIEIENAGPEVTASDIEKMFVFGHSTKKDHLGLGVPLADFGIRLAGGRLDLQPRSGGGLRAFVQLPLAAGLAI